MLETLPEYSRPFDVAIAGAGPAGASLAVWLARKGMRVALLDACSFPREKLCGEFLSPESWGVLDRLGLAGPVAQRGYHPVRRVGLSTPRGRVLEAEIRGPDGLPGLGLSRSVFDEMLMRQARAAGAEVVEGARVAGPLVDEGRVVGLRARQAGLGPIAVRARLTVAANGRHSALVRQTGTAHHGRGSGAPDFGLKRHLFVAEAAPVAGEGTVGLHLLPGGYAGTCRVEGALTNFCALWPASALRRDRGDLDRLAAEQCRRNPALARLWEASTPAGPWKTVAGVRVERATPRLPGILYAGDCQGTVDPLGGQGMTMALLGAEMLVPWVERALGRGADAGLGPACTAAWRNRFGRRIRLCRLFHHVLVNPALVDVASTFQTLAPRLLAFCYNQTRDPEPASALTGESYG